MAVDARDARGLQGRRGNAVEVERQAGNTSGARVAVHGGFGVVVAQDFNLGLRLGAGAKGYVDCVVYGGEEAFWVGLALEGGLSGEGDKRAPEGRVRV